MDEAEYCNRIALIDAGRLVAIGSPGELRRRELGGALVRARLHPRSARRCAALRDAPGVIEAAIFGDKLHVLLTPAGGRGRSAAASWRGSGITAGAAAADRRRAWRTCSSSLVAGHAAAAGA